MRMQNYLKTGAKKNLPFGIVREGLGTIGGENLGGHCVIKVDCGRYSRGRG